MALLSTEANYRASFYRLCGTVSTDAALVENGESINEVCDLCLTHGLRAAQVFLLGAGMSWRWVKRSSAITWLGTEAADGGQYVALPSDLLRLKGAHEGNSPIVEADGEQWGVLVDADKGHWSGDYVYLQNDRLYKTRDASAPTTAYIEYHFQHPEFTVGVTLDFPTDLAGLAVAYGAEFGAADGWLPGGQEMEAKIDRNVGLWEKKARAASRRDRGSRRMTAPQRDGNWWR